MNNLVIEASLESPVILQGHLTFDSFLMALSYEAGHDGRTGLEVTNDLFHASSAIIEPFAQTSIGWAASMRWQHDWPIELMPINSRGAAQFLSTKRKRDFGQILSGYTALCAQAVRWNVCGDRDFISGLIKDVNSIGKKRGQGYGHVTDWKIEEVEHDHSIVGPNGEPMRPVPFDMFSGDAAHPLTEAAWKPEYWNPRNRGACYAPPLH